jgi:DNA-binding NarL/FixJ family response regulator
MHYLEFFNSKGLTKREIDVAELRLCFFPIEKISDDLCISDKTVKFHLSFIYKKFGVNSYLGFYKVLLYSNYLTKEVIAEILEKRDQMLVRRTTRFGAPVVKEVAEPEAIKLPFKKHTGLI